MRSKITINNVTEAFEMTRDLIPLAKIKLLRTCKKVIDFEKSDDFDKGIFLKVLYQIMGIPTL